MTTINANLDLAAWCSQQQAAGLTPWAIVDASGDVDIRALESRTPAFGGVNLLAHRTSAPEALAIAPRMLPLQTPGLIRFANRLFAQQPADEPVLFFVSTPMDAPAFTAAMQRRVTVRLSDGETMLMRWWDARIWWALHQALPLDQALACAFFGVVTQSLYPDRDGQRVWKDQPASATTQDSLPPDWSLDDAVLGRLLELGAPDAVLGVCRHDYLDQLQLVPPAKRHALAQSQIEWAKGCGFTSPQDHALAVRVAAELGLDWASQSPWDELVGHALREGQTLRATVEAA